MKNIFKKKVTAETNKCFLCVWCKFTGHCMQCTHENKKANGRGEYCYPNGYDDCDCGGFEAKAQ